MYQSEYTIEFSSIKLNRPGNEAIR